MEDSMKKLVVLALVLSMATMASAALTVVGAPAGDMTVGDTFTLSIYSDGATLANDDVQLSISGPGSLDLSAGINYQDGGLTVGDGFGWVDDIENGTMWMDFAKQAAGDPPVFPAIMTGTALDGLVFTCTGEGDVTLTLFGPANGTYDTVVITQVPEPITMTLLGLGGLFLRRRSK